MLRSVKDLEGYAVQATDGLIGHVKDIYFDDQQWVARYFVVETGHWFSSRKVLISPIAMGKPDWTGSMLPVSITKEQVKNSPTIDTDRPVSRQHERRHHAYFGYPNYWGGMGLWGSGAYPGEMLANVGYGGCYADYLEGQPKHDQPVAVAEEADHHLRSSNAVMKYQIDATDGEIGHVEDLLVDEDTWAVRYMVVQTPGSWWLGHQVLIAPQWIGEVRWSVSSVTVALTRQAVKDAPRYDAAVMPSREDEKNLYRHHDRIGYWMNEARRQNPESEIMNGRNGAPAIAARPRDNFI